jgi:hypothetical protein
MQKFRECLQAGSIRLPFRFHAVRHTPLQPGYDCQPAVVGYVRSFAGPGRDRAEARQRQHQTAVILFALQGGPVCQQLREYFGLAFVQIPAGLCEMDESCRQ